MSAARPDRSDLKELQTIPGVGREISRDLWSLGIRAVDDLRDRDPEALYRTLCDLQGTVIDRCMLYVLRGAVYYASEPEHEPALLQWWNWTDDRVQARRAARKPSDAG